MNVLLDTATWINAAKEPQTLPPRILGILRNESNAFFLSDISLRKPLPSDAKADWILVPSSGNG